MVFVTQRFGYRVFLCVSLWTRHSCGGSGLCRRGQSDHWPGCVWSCPEPLLQTAGRPHGHRRKPRQWLNQPGDGYQIHVQCCGTGRAGCTAGWVGLVMCPTGRRMPEVCSEDVNCRHKFYRSLSCSRFSSAEWNVTSASLLFFFFS